MLIAAIFAVAATVCVVIFLFHLARPTKPTQASRGFEVIQ